MVYLFSGIAVPRRLQVYFECFMFELSMNSSCILFGDACFDDISTGDVCSMQRTTNKD